MLNTKLLAALALTLAAGALPTAAVAAPPASLTQVVVNYGDLNVASPAGLARLQARIRVAAEQICEPLDTRVLARRSQYEQCLSEAIASTRSQVPTHSARN